MGIVKRINRWVLTRLAHKHGDAPHIVLRDDGRGLSVTNTAAGTQQYEWHDITHIFAIRRDNYAIDTMLLALTFHNKQRIIITEDDPLWETVHKKIETVLPNAIPRDQWLLQVLAAPVGTPVPVFQRT